MSKARAHGLQMHRMVELPEMYLLITAGYRLGETLPLEERVVTEKLAPGFMTMFPV